MFQKINKMKNKKGFTLIELIVVIAIIGILAAIVVPRLSGFQQTAEKKADIVTGKTIATATATLIANEDIDLPASGATTTVVMDGTATADSDEEAIQDMLQSVPTNMAGDVAWTVTISDAGDVAVYADDAATAILQVFPSQGTSYQ